MVFSERDIDLLRLLCWCQYLPPEAACQICPEAEVQLLRSMGLVRQHRTSGALLLTTQGAEWLGGICPGGVPAFSRSYHKSAIQRRLRISRLALTAYRAGVHIFTTSTEELSASPALFFSSITRSRGSNPWGSTRVAALAHLGELLCSIHYVCPGIGKIALTDELTAFNNQTAAFRGLRRVMVFAGESYTSVLSELEAVYPHGDMPPPPSCRKTTAAAPEPQDRRFLHLCPRRGPRKNRGSRGPRTTEAAVLEPRNLRFQNRRIRAQVILISGSLIGVIWKSVRHSHARVRSGWRTRKPS